MRVVVISIPISSVLSWFVSACSILSLEWPVTSSSKTLQNSAEVFRQLIMIELLGGVYWVLYSWQVTAAIAKAIFLSWLPIGSVITKYLAMYSHSKLINQQNWYTVEMTQGLEILACAHLLLQVLACNWNMLMMHVIRHRLIENENLEIICFKSPPHTFYQEETMWPKS